MIQGCVTLDEVFSAAAVRAASLVPETSGYLALAIGDATSRLPFAVDERMVMLTTEGNVGITKRGDVLPPRQAAACFRDLLARLLAVSTGTAMPALASAGRPREESDRGVDAVVGEIEAALIPVNRAAARRALARLARETIKAKEAGKVKPRPSNRPPARNENPPKPVVEAPKVVEAPDVVVAKEEARVAPPPPPVPVAIASSDHTPAPQLVAEATTPPPVDAAPRVVTPPPVVAAPPMIVIATPPPVPVMTPPPAATMRSAPVVILPTPPPVPVAAATPTPLPVEAEPTPTLLGMGAVEIDEPAPELETAAHTEVDAPVAPRTPTPAVLAPITPSPVIAAVAPKTPTPAPIAPKTPTPAPIAVVAPKTPTPAPIASKTPTPAPIATKTPAPVEATAVPVETVTAAPIETVTPASIETVTPAPIETVTAAPIETVTAAPVESVSPAPAETLAEPVVLAQPTESPTTAFELDGRAARPVMDSLTPAFALDAEVALRALPAARALLADPRFTPMPPHYGPPAPTRADDLLARFGAAQMDDRAVREAAAYLRRIAGLEGTPPPPTVEPRPTPPPAPVEPAVVAPARVEEPEPPVSSPRARPRGNRSLPSIGITLAVLVLGLAGGGALVRYRPDLFGVTRPAEPPAQPAPAPPKHDSAAEPPAITAEPRGAQAPAWTPSNAARAERGANERAR